MPLLRKLYEQFIERHSIDAIVLVDGGSDSLMVGDEEGLGDPIEDCVSVTAVASLAGLKTKILISIGFGCDRYNHVSDAASLRAIAELTAQGGFLGAVGMPPTSAGYLFLPGLPGPHLRATGLPFRDWRRDQLGRRGALRQ